MTVVLKGKGEPLSLDPAGQIRTIGERINPSGRKRLQQALANLEASLVSSYPAKRLFYHSNTPKSQFDMGNPG